MRPPRADWRNDALGKVPDKVRPRREIFGEAVDLPLAAPHESKSHFDGVALSPPAFVGPRSFWRAHFSGALSSPRINIRPMAVQFLIPTFGPLDRLAENVGQVDLRVGVLMDHRRERIEALRHISSIRAVQPQNDRDPVVCLDVNGLNEVTGF